MENYEYITIRSVQEIETYLCGASVVAFDFETSAKDKYRCEEYSALDPHKSDITGISLSVKKGTARYIPLRHRTKDNADLSVIMSYLTNRLFKNKGIVKVAHNLAFEAMFLYKYGIVIQEPVYDTIAAAQLTLKSDYEFRTLKDSGLKTLVPYLYHVELPTFEEVTQGKYFDELDPDDWATCRYACADSDWALQLYYTFNNWFDNNLPRHRWICENIESPTAVFTGMMKYNGVGVDVLLMNKKKIEAEEKIIELRAKIQYVVGDIEIGENCGTKAFKDYLFKTAGLPVLKVTEKYAQAADDEVMMKLKEWCVNHKSELVEFFDTILEFRKWGKLSGTYIEGYLKYLNNASGRIHADIMPMATETGRFACRRPNIQNQPAIGSDPLGVRNFIVSGEGKRLLEADYSQAEIRLAAYLGQDETLLGAYSNGEDVHAITTSAIFGIPLSEAADKSKPEYKHRRTVAKSTMFGIMYGMSGFGLSRNLFTNAGIKLSTEDCGRYISGVLEKYTQLADWQKFAIREAKIRGYAETALGRRRYLPEIKSYNSRLRRSAERMAMNTPVQGLGADCLKLAMARLVKSLETKPYIRPLFTVHDSIVFEVEEVHVDEAIGIVKSCMEEKPSLDNFMPLIADVAVGERYGMLE